jgi:hypothetical protein
MDKEARHNIRVSANGQDLVLTFLPDNRPVRRQDIYTLRAQGDELQLLQQEADDSQTVTAMFRDPNTSADCKRLLRRARGAGPALAEMDF